MDIQERGQFLPTVGSFRQACFEVPTENLPKYTSKQFRLFIAAARKHVTSLYKAGTCVFFAIAYMTGMCKGKISPATEVYLPPRV